MKEEKPLMRQKVNLTSKFLQSLKSNFLHMVRNVINSHLLKPEDLGAKFVLDDREFKLIGATQSGTMMLEEIYNGVSIYWECSRNLVQFKLDRFYTEFKKIDNCIANVKKDYDLAKLALPIQKTVKKEKVVETEDAGDFIDDILDEE